MWMGPGGDDSLIKTVGRDCSPPLPIQCSQCFMCNRNRTRRMRRQCQSLKRDIVLDPCQIGMRWRHNVYDSLLRHYQQGDTYMNLRQLGRKLATNHFNSPMFRRHRSTLVKTSSVLSILLEGHPQYASYLLDWLTTSNASFR